MFKLHANYHPTGDQPAAIKKLTENIKNGMKRQTLLGATGTGKTFTIANVIQNCQMNALVLEPNKTLAGQIYAELKSLFPENRVEYFISYYDYYQPEAYVARKDLYIEKDSSINDDIDQMRHSAVSSLLTSRNVIVVCSVSCIYGIGSPEDYENNMLLLRVNDKLSRTELCKRLVSMQYERATYEFKRGTFRVSGDTTDIYLPGDADVAMRISFFDEEIESIKAIDALTGNFIESKNIITVYPASFFAINENKMKNAILAIKEELKERVAYFKQEKKLLEAERISQRTKYDIEMLEEMGLCKGIENYSLYLTGRKMGEAPYTLLDYYKNNFLTVIDESHVSIPQLRGMYNGDRARKESLVEYGFRLPSALENRPLSFAEFDARLDRVIYVSATPQEYEKKMSEEIVEQIIRPTGLLDPEVEIRPTLGQIDDLVQEIRKRKALNERALIVTLTIKMSEELTSYLKDLDFKVACLHAEVKALERLEIIRSLRLGIYDCIVGINLLREGLDLPEVSLVAVLDADKEGFLRSEVSLIQTIGRAARNSSGKVIMYADNVTASMEKAISETYRRRMLQDAYNKKNNIIPATVKKEIAMQIGNTKKEKYSEGILDLDNLKSASALEKKNIIDKLTLKMKQEAGKLNFEEAMALRDIIMEIKAGN